MTGTRPKCCGKSMRTMTIKESTKNLSRKVVFLCLQCNRTVMSLELAERKPPVTPAPQPPIDVKGIL